MCVCAPYSGVCELHTIVVGVMEGCGNGMWGWEGWGDGMEGVW